MLRNIHLHGELGERFGREFRLDVETPAEAIRALTTQLAGLETEIRKGEFICIRGDYETGIDCDEELLTLNLGSLTDFHVVPATVGRGSGGGKILLGVLLIGATIFTAGAFFGAALGMSFTSAAGAYGIGGALAAGMGGLGAYTAGIGGLLILSGTAQAITTMPSASGLSGVDDRPGYLFNGAVNSSEQGGAVPLVFGRIRAGSVVVSAGVTAERISEAVSGSSDGSSTGSIGGLPDVDGVILLDRVE